MGAFNKILEIEDNGVIVGYCFECPGCQLTHAPYVKPHKNIIGASWEFNGDLKKPTFKPSIKSVVIMSDDKIKICHSYVIDGCIHFLSDCTHSLSGQIVELKNIEV